MIEELEQKGFRICIVPQKWNKNWYWVSGVYIGDNIKAHWVDSNNGLPKAAYITYKEALDAAINYCTEYGSKRSQWGKV